MLYLKYVQFLKFTISFLRIESHREPPLAKCFRANLFTVHKIIHDLLRTSFWRKHRIEHFYNFSIINYERHALQQRPDLFNVKCWQLHGVCQFQFFVRENWKWQLKSDSHFFLVLRILSTQSKNSVDSQLMEVVRMVPK